MTREKVFNKVENIFKDIFDDSGLSIEDSTNSDDIEEWDSLNHIYLVSAIEKDFNIRFALGELISLKDVGSMIDLMLIKISYLNE